MAFISRDGIRIHYEDAGAGPAVVLSHAFSASSRMWSGQVAALKEHYRVVTWDMRGHAESDSPEDPAAYSEAATVGDLAAVVDAAGIESAVFGGLSLGGYISLAYALANPSRVRALMLFDTGPGFRDPVARARWNENAYRQAEGFESAGLAHLSGTHGDSAGHRSAAGLAHAARGMLTKHDAHVIESLDAISVPSLVLVGENDTPLLAAADHLASRIKGAQKVVIPGAGHYSNLDQPAAFNAAMLGFLESLAGAR